MQQVDTVYPTMTESSEKANAAENELNKLITVGGLSAISLQQTASDAAQTKAYRYPSPGAELGC